MEHETTMYNHHYPYHHDNHHCLEDLILSNNVSDAARDTVDAVRDSIDATNQIGNIGLQSTERNGGETRSTTERAAGVIRDHISNTANQASRDHTRIISELCDIRKEMSDGFGETKLEMCKQHGDIKLEMCKQHGELSRQIDARAAEAAKQLAECCCELKLGQVEIRHDIQTQASASREEALKNELERQRQDLLLLKVGNINVA